MEQITDMEQNTAGKKDKRKKGFKSSRDVPVYLLLAPGILLLLIFHYLPIAGLLIAFKDYSLFRGIMKSSWVGFDNFIYFLSDSNFWKVFRNTLAINIMQILWGFPIPIIFALILNELWSNKFKKTLQTVSYLPYFISWVVAAGIITSVLSPSTGLVNNVLVNIFGIEPIFFLGKPQYFRSIVVTSSIWKSFGMTSVYYISTIASIDVELYEAARIDGAGRWKQTLNITLPALKTIIIVLLVINIGHMVTIGFEQIFLLYNPVVYDVGDVISTYTYRLGIEQTQYSLTSAIGLTQSVINFILVFSANRLSKKIAGWSLW